MADLARYLRRFRRLVSPPGRPGPGGVPRERGRELADELAEVFAAIDAIADEADRIRQEGEEAARQRREGAEQEVERILAAADDEAEQARADAAAAHRRDLLQGID